MARSTKRTPVAVISTLLRMREDRHELHRLVRRVERQRLRAARFADTDDFLSTSPTEIRRRTLIHRDCRTWVRADDLDSRRRALRK